MLYDWSMESNHYSKVFGSVAHFAKHKTLNYFLLLQNMNSGDKNERVPNPARIPPQTPPAGGTEAEAGRIHISSQLFRPAESALVFRVLRKMGSYFFKQTPQFKKLLNPLRSFLSPETTKAALFHNETWRPLRDASNAE